MVLRLLLLELDRRDRLRDYQWFLLCLHLFVTTGFDLPASQNIVFMALSLYFIYD
jgi:hypothetical protein